MWIFYASQMWIHLVSVFTYVETLLAYNQRPLGLEWLRQWTVGHTGVFT